MNAHEELAAIAARYGKNVRRPHLRIPCPVHGGRDPNLAVWVRGNEVKVQCHSHNCDWRAIKSALGLLDDAPRTPVTPEQRTAAQVERDAEIAAAKVEAQRMLDAATYAPHPYLERKGFSNERGMTLAHDYYGHVLLLPLRTFAGELLCVQAVTETGEKRFLPQGCTSLGGVFMLGNRRGARWWVEGYATGLSVRAALKRLYRTDDLIIIAFSAHTLATYARSGVVIADHDRFTCSACHHRWYGDWETDRCPRCGDDHIVKPAGEDAARKTGRRWWMPPADDALRSTDANDFALAHGIDALADALRSLSQ